MGNKVGVIDGNELGVTVGEKEGTVLGVNDGDSDGTRAFLRAIATCTGALRAVAE